MRRPTQGPWHVIIGKSFAGVVTHETDYVVFFDVLPRSGERDSALMQRVSE